MPHSKTLSYIAYMQPISSKQLVETRGSGVYAHLKELSQLRFYQSSKCWKIKNLHNNRKISKIFWNSRRCRRS